MQLLTGCQFDDISIYYFSSTGAKGNLACPLTCTWLGHEEYKLACEDCRDIACVEDIGTELSSFGISGAPEIWMAVGQLKAQIITGVQKIACGC